jgi:FHA domain-containing protein/zinc ribbon protein
MPEVVGSVQHLLGHFSRDFAMLPPEGTMSACPQCGTPARPTDRFCNACGTPIARASTPAAPAAPGYATPPPPAFAPPPGPPGYGAAPGRAPVARCQMGHEIAPGTSYCAQGHPIALEQMQFANEAYPGPGGFGAPGPGAYGAPPAYPAPGPPPGPGYGMPPAPPPFAAPGAQPSFGSGPPPAAPYPIVSDTARDPVPPKVLRGFLVAYGTNPSGDFWPLPGGRLVVGRLGSADRIDVPLQDPTISSRHAAILVDATSGTIMVEDTGSTNGTFVNDEHVGFNGRRDLRDGDRLRFGAFTTIVKVIGRV